MVTLLHHRARRDVPDGIQVRGRIANSPPFFCSLSGFRPRVRRFTPGRQLIFLEGVYPMFASFFTAWTTGIQGLFVNNIVSWLTQLLNTIFPHASA